MANLTPPPDGNTNIAPLYNITCTVMFGVAVAIYSLRMYVRFKHLALEDYTISVAVAISITEVALVWQASRYGCGRHNYYVSAENKTMVFRYMFGVVIVGLWSATLVRISVALMLLKLKDTWIWKSLLRAAIATQFASMVSVNICQLLQCRPIRAMWDYVPDAKCWNVYQMAIYGYVHASLGASCDLLFTFMLLYLIRGLHRSRSEKILLGCLMSLGLFASAAALVKIAYMDRYDLAGDSLRKVMIITLTVRIEEVMGMIAACAPYLKNMVASCLYYLGVKLKQGTVWYLATLAYKSTTGEPTLGTGSDVEIWNGAETSGSVERTENKGSAINMEDQRVDPHELHNDDGIV